MISAEIVSGGLRRGIDGREDEREPIHARGSLAAATGDRTLVRVSDISVRGARLETYIRLDQGMEMTLHLRGAPPLDGHIAWATDFAAGLAFNERLDETTVEMLVDLYGFGTAGDPEIISKS